jgi:pimeloyl-ACP methyl ester carboxylesterase
VVHFFLKTLEDLACLLEHLAIAQAVICGVSYGGVLAMRFTLDYPQYCRALCVIDSYCTTRPQNIRDLGWLINVYLGAPSNLLPKSWLAAIMKRIYKKWPEAAVRMAKIARSLRGFETMKTRLAINHIDYLSELGAITIPTFCAVGQTSWPLSIVYMRRVAEAITGCDRLHIIQDAYDPSNLCQVAVFNKLLSAFLAELCLL